MILHDIADPFMELAKMLLYCGRETVLLDIGLGNLMILVGQCVFGNFCMLVYLSP